MQVAKENFAVDWDKGTADERTERLTKCNEKAISVLHGGSAQKLQDMPGHAEDERLKSTARPTSTITKVGNLT